jgi:hypothetical protein
MALESARPTVSIRKFVFIINEIILGIVKKEYHTKGISTVCSRREREERVQKRDREGREREKRERERREKV